MKKGTVAVRLEGGIGDHIMGMRLLYFIKKRYPYHKIIGYSDSGGNQAQLEVAQMSPFLSDVIAVYHKKRAAVDTWGRLENIEKKYIDMMNSSDAFFDTWENTFFIPQAKALNVPFFEILTRRPELEVSKKDNVKAYRILNHYKNSIFIGLDVSKHRLHFLSRHKEVVLEFIKELLKNPKVIILNFYISNFQFSHWPKASAIKREMFVARESTKIGELWNIDKRVIPIVDFPVAVVAALIKRCRYYIGVDNGLKHLAWALGIPHSFFIPAMPSVPFVMRYMPDFHRSLLFNCSKNDFLMHLLEALRIIDE